MLSINYMCITFEKDMGSETGWGDQEEKRGRGNHV